MKIVCTLPGKINSVLYFSPLMLQDIFVESLTDLEMATYVSPGALLCTAQSLRQS